MIALIRRAALYNAPRVLAILLEIPPCLLQLPVSSTLCSPYFDTSHRQIMHGKCCWQAVYMGRYLPAALCVR
jgi:hypothetical protein